MIKPPVMPRSPHIRMARWPKTPVEFERCSGAEGVDTTTLERELCSLVCNAGTFIGCVDNAKSEKIGKGDKTTKV